MNNGFVYFKFDETVSFLPNRDELVNSENKERIKLDNLEALVLTRLIETPKTIISNSQLYTLWENRYVSQNSLTRVISLLRKKLKSVGIEQNLIVNRSKRGYIFDCEPTQIVAFQDLSAK